MNELFTLGDTLRMAREGLKMSQHDVAEATRMKVHIIDAIEHNDFSRIEVPLYGKGFIKIYAEHVGLDPKPLIRDYLANYARTVRPSLKSEHPVAPTSEGHPVPSMPSAKLARKSRQVDWRGMADVVIEGLGQTLSRMAVWVARLRASLRAAAGRHQGRRYHDFSPGRSVAFGRYAAIAGGVIVVVLLVLGIGRIARRERPASTPAATVATAPAKAPVPLRLAEEPPAPYLKIRQP